MTPDLPFVAEDDQLVVERDDDAGLLEVRGWSPGPAGTAPLELRGVSGARSSFGRGDLLYLQGVPLRALHNPGSEPAVLVAVSR